MSSPLAPARASAQRRFRLAVVAASVIAAIVGSVLLVTHRSSAKVNAATGSTGLSALPPSGKVIARIRVGRATAALGQRGGGPFAVGEGAVWAMSDTKSMLMRIDPERNAVVARIPVDVPETVAAGDGAVWLSNPSENTVTRVDPATNKVIATIPVGPQPEGIAVSPGAVWVATAGLPSVPPSVSRIDPATNRVIATIPVGARGACCAEHTAVIASRHAVWVALKNANSIVHVDPVTNRVVGIARIAYPPCGLLAADKTGVWSAGCSNLVGRIDARTNKLTDELTEISPVGIQVGFGSVWVALQSGNVDRIDLRSKEIVARLHIVGLPELLSVGYGSVWVNDDYGRVLRIKPQR